MDRKKKIDLVVLLLYPIVSAALSHLLQANGFFSLLLFFGIPALYLTVRAKEYAKKSLLFAVVLSLPLIIILDYICHVSGQWVIPSSIFPFRLFQYVSIEILLWAVLNIYTIVMFYEHFLHHHLTKRVWNPHMKYLVMLVLSLFIVFVMLYAFAPTLLKIPYFYLWLGSILFLTPLVLQLWTHPRFVSKFFETAAYFFYMTLIYEITALQRGWWDFPGKEFIGWVSLGSVKFPVEELVFFLMLFSMAVLTYYEFFEEDEK